MTRSNNYDALRLLGAAMVLLGHAYHLLGRGDEVPFVLGYPVSTLGVVIFFSISGYLITISWVSKRDLRAYAAARLLRIMPGLVVVVLLCALVLGPLATALPRGTYFSSPQFTDYLGNILLRPAYALPGVWHHLPYPDAVNGSLWTLPAEFFCYLVVPLVAVRVAAARLVVLAGLLAASFWLAGVPALDSPVIWGSRLSDAASMWTFFIAGSGLATLRSRWPQLLRTDVATAALGGYLLLLAVLPQSQPYVAAFTLPYVVLAMGDASTPYVRRAARFGDFSYGLYLWGFPVQQIVVWTLGVQRMAVDLPIVSALTLLAAYASWHVVEQPSLRWKDRLVRRRRLAHLPVTAEPALSTSAGDAVSGP